MARTHASVLVLMAIAVAGCGFAGVPRMGLGAGGSRPAIEEPDADMPVPPTFKAPVISDEAMERAVQAGLARSDDETSRKVESCLTPTGSQLEQMLEQLQTQRGRGAAPDIGQLTFRSASLDPRLGRARVLKQQGSVTEDPIFLSEPLIKSEEFNLVPDPNDFNPFYPCEPADEGEFARGAVPSYFAGENPYVSQYAAEHNLPQAVTLGGSETMYPEYRAKVKGLPVAVYPAPGP